MKKGLLVFLLSAFYLPVYADTFIACRSLFALCTTATCNPIPGKQDVVNCSCKVIDGYSAGAEPCQEETTRTTEGDVIYSRYSPIKWYVKCNNDRPWAWCLDKRCKIDKHDPSKASCMCSVVRDQPEYIIVTNQPTRFTCTTGMYSSATVDQVEDITNFLKTQKYLQPHQIEVYNAPRSVTKKNHEKYDIPSDY